MKPSNRRPSPACLFAIYCVLSTAGNAQMMQSLPAGFDVAMGGSGTSFPFGSAGDHIWQWHYDSSEFVMQQPVRITEIAIRASSGTSTAFNFTSVVVDMAVASTDYQAATHDLVFANNILSSATVRTGPWSGPATAGFVPLGLTSSFTYDPSTGDDFIIQITKCGTTSTFGTVDGAAAGAGLNGGNRYGNTGTCTATAENFRNNEYVPIVLITYELVGPQCAITSPMAGTVVTGSVNIDYDVDHTMMLPVDLVFEWSTDAGMTYLPATPGGMSMNPLLGVGVPASLSFEWNTGADAIGAVMVQTTTFRITATDGVDMATCSVDVDVDNVAPIPTCTLTLVGATPAGGDVDFDLLADSLSAATIDALFEYSTDSGVTWLPATPAAGTNPLLGVPTMVLTTFTWDSRGDTVGVLAIAPGVLLRATVSDGVSFVDGTCQEAPFDVDNTSLCGGICGDCNLSGTGPDILDSLTAAQLAAGLASPMGEQIGCCDHDGSMTIAILDALLIAQDAAGLMTTPACP